LKKYDVSKSGGLTYHELKGFLKELQPARAEDITDGELKWVIQMSTTEKQDFTGEWTSGVKQLEGKALEIAAKEWLQYLQNYDEISGVFDTHCADGSGFLNKDQLTAVLTDLNDGEPPDPTDVDKVLEQASIVTAGQLSKPAFVQAISVWYSIEDEKEFIAQADSTAVQGGSACCTIA